MHRRRQRRQRGARLLEDGFVRRFEELAEQADSVWLGSAWITLSKPLARLLPFGNRVRALAGTHGNATDPDAIQALIDADCHVRLVNGGPLFHPKIYLFRRCRGKTVGWIGSANFTGGGFTANLELVLEFDDECAIAEAESWFKAQWRSLRGQDVNAALREYREERDKHGVAHLGLIVGVEADSGVERAGAATGAAAEGPQHLGDLRKRDKYRFEYFGEDRWARSHAELARRVLLAFAGMDADFFDSFAQKDKERVAADRRTKRRYVSRVREDLGEEQELPENALTKDRAWWMAQKLQDYHFFQGKAQPGILKMACDTFGVTYGEGALGRIDFQSGGPARPKGYKTGDQVVVRIGCRAENHLLG